MTFDQLYLDLLEQGYSPPDAKALALRLISDARAANNGDGGIK